MYSDEMVFSYGVAIKYFTKIYSPFIVTSILCGGFADNI